jgi:hypothetical protein
VRFSGASPSSPRSCCSDAELEPVNDPQELVGKRDHVDDLARIIEIDLVMRTRIFAERDGAGEQFARSLPPLRVTRHQGPVLAEGLQHQATSVLGPEAAFLPNAGLHLFECTVAHERSVEVVREEVCLAPGVKIIELRDSFACARDKVVLAIHVVWRQGQESFARQPIPGLHEAERDLASRNHLQEVESVRLGASPRHVFKQVHAQILGRHLQQLPLRREVPHHRIDLVLVGHRAGPQYCHSGVCGSASTFIQAS